MVQLYADAFITVHGVRRSINRWLEELFPIQELKQAANGFGAVVAILGRPPIGFREEVPAQPGGSLSFISFVVPFVVSVRQDPALTDHSSVLVVSGMFPYKRVLILFIFSRFSSRKSQTHEAFKLTPECVCIGVGSSVSEVCSDQKSRS